MGAAPCSLPSLARARPKLPPRHNPLPSLSQAWGWVASPKEDLITLTLTPPLNPPPNPPLNPPLTLTRNPSRSEEWKEEADSKLAAKEEDEE